MKCMPRFPKNMLGSLKATFMGGTIVPPRFQSKFSTGVHFEKTHARNYCDQTATALTYIPDLNVARFGHISPFWPDLAILARFDHFGHLRAILAIFAHFGTFLLILAHFRSFWHISAHFGTFLPKLTFFSTFLKNSFFQK